MVIRQSMGRNSSFYHALATTLLANHSDFFNTNRRLHQLTCETGKGCGELDPNGPRSSCSTSVRTAAFFAFRVATEVKFAE